MALLLKGNRYTTHTFSRNLHYNMMFFFDEGLVEKGFYTHIQDPYTVGTTNLAKLIATTDANVYDFPFDRLVWQTGITTSFGTTISGVRNVKVYNSANVEQLDIDINNATYSDWFWVDYHNGQLIFNDASASGDIPTVLTNTYGAGWYLKTDYYAKQVYVAYQNDKGIVSMLDYITTTWDSDLNLSTSDYKFPILVGGLNDNTTVPYEIGGTKSMDVNYKAILLSDTQEMRDMVCDMISMQKEVMPPSRIWGDMYDSDGKIQYSSLQGYMAGCSTWYDFRIEDLRAVRFGENIYAAEFDINILVIGVN